MRGPICRLLCIMVLSLTKRNGNWKMVRKLAKRLPGVLSLTKRNGNDLNTDYEALVV